MRLFTEKYRLLAWLAALLIVGFLTTSLVSYYSSRYNIRQNIIHHSLPITSDNIYSEIQKDILQPIFIASAMANDTFLKDWILAGEKNPTAIKRYLSEIKEKNHTITSFFVSDLTQNYYYADGLLKKVSENENRDIWFYRVKKAKEDYEINLDVDMANHDTVTVFINHKINDDHGRFLGAVGVGLTVNAMSHLIHEYESRFQRTVYFTDNQGRVVLSDQTTPKEPTLISTSTGLSLFQSKILVPQNQPIQLEYNTPQGKVLVSARYIPELKWYLLVEQNESAALLPLQHVLQFNLLVALGVSLLVLLAAGFFMRRYQGHLEYMATHDVLTGCLNHQAFEIIFSNLIRQTRRSKQPLSAILLDVDHFKQINDTEGHLAGDDTLKNLVSIIHSMLRDSDTLARWGGEEFMILLHNCPLENALDYAEKLRLRIQQHTFTVGQVTASMGVAEHRSSETADMLFMRMDKALYRAKKAGRNRIESAQDDISTNSRSAA